VEEDMSKKQVIAAWQIQFQVIGACRLNCTWLWKTSSQTLLYATSRKWECIMENMRFLSRTRTLDHQFQVICCLMVTFKQEISFSMSNLIGRQCSWQLCKIHYTWCRGSTCRMLIRTMC
jgi:hypothetical protein